MDNEDVRLTDEQIENWRKVLCVTLGPFALVMTREQIQAYRDRLQREAVEVRASTYSLKEEK